MIEVVRQLRGEAGGRQAECAIGLVTSMGGIFATNSIAILGTEQVL